MSTNDLSVDYGTSNTVATLRWPDGRMRPLLFDGSPQLPSAVFLADDGRLYTGLDAVRAARFDPMRYEPHPKRRVDDLEVLLGGATMPVERLIAATLARVAGEAARTLGGPPNRVVLTHPVVWGPARRAVLVEAAQSIGLTNVVLVPEPVAAATYLASMSRQVQADGSNVLVYDLGAGTFDATLVTRRGGEFVTLAYRGLEDVGGLDFDAVVVDRVGAAVPEQLREAWQRILAPVDIDSRRHNRMLWEDAKAAKEMLSREASTGLHLPGLELDTIVTRAEFEKDATALIDRTVEITAATLRESRIRTEQLSAVFLVGGGSRIPLVATLLHRRLGMAPTVLEQPEAVVAEGGLGALALRPVSAPPGRPVPTSQPPGYPPRPTPLPGGAPGSGWAPGQPPPQAPGSGWAPVQQQPVPGWAPGQPVPGSGRPTTQPGQPAPGSGWPTAQPGQPVPAPPGGGWVQAPGPPAGTAPSWPAPTSGAPQAPGRPAPTPARPAVMNRLRLAFEAGRISATVCQWDQLAVWYGSRLGEIFGPVVLAEFRNSHAIVRGGDGELFYAEQARWRARFGVLLEEQPSWDQPLHRLVTEAQQAIRQAQARYPWQGGRR